MPNGHDRESQPKPDSLIKSLGIATGTTAFIAAILSFTPYADLPSQSEIRTRIAAKEAGQSTYAQQLRDFIVVLQGHTASGYHINKAHIKKRLIFENPSSPDNGVIPEPTPPPPKPTPTNDRLPGRPWIHVNRTNLTTT